MLKLSVGMHASRYLGTCLLEATAMLAGEEHGDHPSCVSPLLIALGIHLNDGLFRDCLERLAPYAARLVNTADPALEQRRQWCMLDWAIREVLPLAMGARCQAVRDLPKVTDMATLSEAIACLDCLCQGQPALPGEALEMAASVQYILEDWQLYGCLSGRRTLALLDMTGIINRQAQGTLQERALDLLDRLIAMSHEQTTELAQGDICQTSH